jgi:hypothetical protein
MAIENKLPKGPSNSAGMGATPGTQQTAMNNVATGGFNPNMPIAPQAARQQRSSYQQSISPQAPMPAPRPVAKAKAPATPKGPDTRTITQGMPMQPGRGYNIFSGMDAGQISSMNQSMGLSNMTALPSLQKPNVVDGTYLQKGPQMQQTLMSGSGTDNTYTDSAGFTYTYDPETGMVTVTKPGTGGASGSPDYQDTLTWQDFVAQGSGNDEDLEAFKEFIEGAVEEESQKSSQEKALEEAGLAQKETKTYGSEAEEAEDGEFEDEQSKSDEALEIAGKAAIGATDGIPDEDLEGLKEESKQKIKEYESELAEKKSAAQADLDEKAALLLQQSLLGIDRQMAMAGMFGSGAHTSAINNAASQVLTGLLNEYNALNAQEINNLASFMTQEFGTAVEYNILDLNMSDADEQELFNNMIVLANSYAQKEQLTEDDLNEILNISEFFDETKTAEISEYAMGSVGNISGVAKEAFLGVLAQIQGSILQDTMPPNATLTKQQAAKNYIGAADILIQAMNAYVLATQNPSQGTGDIDKFLNQLVSLYGVDLPQQLENIVL